MGAGVQPQKQGELCMMIRFLMWLYGVTEARAAARAPIAWFAVLMIAVGIVGCIYTNWGGDTDADV